MKITVYFKDSAVQPIEIDNFEKIIIGNGTFTAEEFALKAIPIDKKEFYSIVSQKEVLVVNTSEIAYIRLLR